MEYERGRQTGIARTRMEQALAGEEIISVGTVYVNGTMGEHGFSYRMTPHRLLWNRLSTPEVDGFSFEEIRRFCLADAGHPLATGPALRIDLGERVLDLYLNPAGPTGDRYLVWKQQFLASLIDELKRRGVRYVNF
jgi:hypothetical protein